jgi:3-deoxy-D-manno-octulosonic-acid transferase
METEIWPRFIREAKASGAKIAIVNGRLSQKSFSRYSKVQSFIRRVLADIDLAMMQTDADADRLKRLGIGSEKVAVTGNLKFEQTADKSEGLLTDEFRSRFAISRDKLLVIAASTHEPEERYVIESLEGELGHSCRLMIAPRHPERFNDVENLIRESGHSLVRRSAPPADADAAADIILLDSIGELRAAYPLAEIVFVGGSLIPHGGQSVLEPAVAGKAIVTGPYTHNFKSIVEDLTARTAIIQVSTPEDESHYVPILHDLFGRLLGDPVGRESIGKKAASAMKANRGAAAKTVEFLQSLSPDASAKGDKR